MELLTEVFELCWEAKLTHFLFGSSPEVLARMERQLAESFPEAEIAGSFSPPFGRLDEVDFGPAVEAIRAASPDIVWCGLGAPKQELWMQRHARQIAPAVVLGVGAAFDFAAGTKQRAPHSAQDKGRNGFTVRLGAAAADRPRRPRPGSCSSGTRAPGWPAAGPSEPRRHVDQLARRAARLLAERRRVGRLELPAGPALG